MYDCEFVFWNCEDRRVEIRKGRIFCDNSRVIFEECDVKPKYIACPAFINSHTHLGDSIAKDPAYSGIEVVMPGGYKFRMLERYSKECEDAMRESILFSALSGTLRIYDFREGGVEGVEMLKRADKAKICKVLGRPDRDLKGAEEVIRIADGFGISSVRDTGQEIAERLAELARKYRKLFFIHAGEVDSKDVEGAIELRPDALIHMNMASKEQIRKVMDEGIPVVSCIRSNMFFNVVNVESYRRFIEYGIEEGKWFLGTDNVMLCSPNMLEEMHFASYLLREDEGIFRAATSGIVDGLELGAVVFHRRMNFSRVRNPLSTIVRRGCIEDIECVLPGKVKVV